MTDRQTDGLMNGWTDRPSYRDTLTHVKTTVLSLCYLDLPQLCLNTLHHPSVTMGDPKQPETYPKPPDFPLPPLAWLVCSQFIVNTTMQPQCYPHLPQLCLGRLSQPSLTMGDPLTAPKRPETRPKPPDFSFCTCDMISLQLFHSRKDCLGLKAYAFPSFTFFLFLTFSIMRARDLWLLALLD